MVDLWYYITMNCLGGEEGGGGGHLSFFLYPSLGKKKVSSSGLKCSNLCLCAN